MQVKEPGKIIIIGPSLKMGGIERASANIANFAAIEGHHVTYIALFKQDHFIQLNHSIRFIEPNENLNTAKLELIKSLLWLRKQIFQINPDTVLVFNYFYAAIVRLSLVGTSIPCFVSDRASPHYKWQKHIALFNYIVYKIFPPSGVIAQTKIAAEYKKQFFGIKTQIKIIPNALREVKLYPEVKRKTQVLAVGRLSDHLKGFDRLIEAFAKVKNKDWQLVFAGGDLEGEHLKQQAKNLGIADRIVFLGKVKEIDLIYAQSGIFVIPSRSEGFPNSLCEAMAAGLPCIAFNFVAGPLEIITNKVDGFIVEDGNIKDLAAQIDYLIENKAIRNIIGQKAKNINERLNLRKIGEEYLNFIIEKRILND